MSITLIRCKCPNSSEGHNPRECGGLAEISVNLGYSGRTPICLNCLADCIHMDSAENETIHNNWRERD